MAETMGSSTARAVSLASMPSNSEITAAAVKAVTRFRHSQGRRRSTAVRIGDRALSSPPAPTIF